MPVLSLFQQTALPRVYGVPPGVDFPAALLTGLEERLCGQPPEALARIHLVVNSQRMRRRLERLLHSTTPCLLPSIDLVTTYHGNAPRALMLPPAIPSLRRQLQLGQLIGKLLDQQPDLAPQACRYHLAKSLARLMDELQGEGIDPQIIQGLDMGELSGHWQRSQSFLSLVQTYLQTIGGLDSQARQRQVVEHLIAHWQSHPPNHPVIVAGSTGSRGSTQQLMQAVARLNQGAVVLPGFDFDLPTKVWEQFDQTQSATPYSLEDHPQQRFLQLLQKLQVPPDGVKFWTEAHQPAAPERNRLVSLALRPAPVTDAWLKEGPLLGHLGRATNKLTLLEAPNLRQESLAIALRLRQALEDNQRAALMTPDRRLARHVSAALDRWGITPNDSAGLPLQLSPPGRFLRLVIYVMTQPLTTSRLLSLIQHPLCHSKSYRLTHLRYTRNLELWLRKENHSFHTATVLQAFIQRKHQQIPRASNTPTEATWIQWLNACLPEPRHGEQPLSAWVQQLQDVSLRLVAGCSVNGANDTNSSLWKHDTGKAVQEIVTGLAHEAAEGGPMDGFAFAELLQTLLSENAVRNLGPEGNVVIWSPWEARSHNAELLILGGLNEGCWPEAIAPDPWLNRTMRRQAGLNLPEQQLGLAAHDMQQAIAAPQVWLSRSTRSDDGETVPCRWLNRLTNLLRGLPEQEGPQCLKAMAQRGQYWLHCAQELDKPTPGLIAAPRPCPSPPIAARPKRLSVTEIRTLVKDPYSIYAKHVLRLVPLNPLEQGPNALLRGVAIHQVMEKFLRSIQGDSTALAPEQRLQTREKFLQLAEDTLRETVPWPAVQRLWLARLDRLADWFLRTEVERQGEGKPFAFEVKGETSLNLHSEDEEPLQFTLSARADRIDKGCDCWLIYDYKTGVTPSTSEQKNADKQLLLEVAMVERGAFTAVQPGPAKAWFIGLGSNPRQQELVTSQESSEEAWSNLHVLLFSYLNPHKGYQSRRLLRTEPPGPYDHLARFGEWDSATLPMANQEVL